MALLPALALAGSAKVMIINGSSGDKFFIHNPHKHRKNRKMNGHEPS
jgi:hypothetical protein